MERILLHLANRENRALVAEVLQPLYEVVFAFADEADETAPELDLVILDGSSLQNRMERLAFERSAVAPVMLPVLLLSDRRSVTFMTQEHWDLVDDVALRPLSRVELRARVESLLKARRLSLKLRDVSTAYQHERRVAQRFQKAALPRALPSVGGLSFSSFYRPGIDESQIGGDWYDALELDDGRVMVSIGDVCGSGLDAAVAMANARQLLRGVAQIHDDPATMLDATHRAVRAEDPNGMVTAFVGIFDFATNHLTYATAGHPRPLIRYPDGTIKELQATGAPLGLPFVVERTVETVDLPLGALLVLYTDGLTEATRNIADGEDRLRAAINDADVLRSPNIALAIHDYVLAEGARDDVAVMTMARADDKGRLWHWSFDVNDYEMTYSVRQELVKQLERGGVPHEARVNAELVFSELIGNVVRFAPRWADITLDWNGGRPVLHVLDAGPGFRHSPKLPDSVLTEHGRGLYIVSRLTSEFQVSRRPSGGSHARAVLSA